MSAHDLIRQKLEQREQAGSYRKLRTAGTLIDLCSNDYLGFARSAELKAMVEEEIVRNPDQGNGSGGSRLLSGNTAYTEELEQWIATYHQSDAGLLFNSGYDANLGLLSSVPQRGDTVLHDALAHASIIDGIRLSHSTRQSFAHNDLADLEHKLRSAKGNIFIVLESVYSMDGDLAPLTHLARLSRAYNAALIVDEAHAVGVLGKGLVNELELHDQVFARVVTFGKALGCHGAIVLGSNDLRNYLINFARSFIYTTAAPFHQLATIKMAYQLLNSAEGFARTAALQQIATLYDQLMIGTSSDAYTSAIRTLIIGGNEETKHAADQLQQAGFDVRAILSPTVAAGSERLRICLHQYNTEEQILALVAQLKLLQDAR
ncbi:8-amino-7-oxononanoate synthase [Mucilaginibacter daejeonensis]|uniref:aminotransferase class I/II-fold pyridoxal phosphate-dependent enzyme n=1 Tax=Mucilaginibacter daejeonensis TaxID=398049 RepID=UPI001D1771A9|nr:8-amino-7-oxononanoate synthase [Mucilaginibacter daejeonensis]UEG51951.1 8-amino-7-oxononanoate synthase [Mucilaginibacter daejeonensis]